MVSDEVMCVCRYCWLTCMHSWAHNSGKTETQETVNKNCVWATDTKHISGRIHDAYRRSNNFEAGWHLLLAASFRFHGWRFKGTLELPRNKRWNMRMQFIWHNFGNLERRSSTTYAIDLLRICEHTHMAALILWFWEGLDFDMVTEYIIFHISAWLRAPQGTGIFQFTMLLISYSCVENVAFILS